MGAQADHRNFIIDLENQAPVLTVQKQRPIPCNKRVERTLCNRCAYPVSYSQSRTVKLP
jgi:hypothetical protein